MVSKIKLKSKRTKAQKPAPKKNQIVGSKKNPKGSAGGSRGKIEVSQKVVKQMKSVDEKNQKLRAYGEAIQVNALNEYDVPEGLTIGKTFKTLSLGQVSSRMSGDAIGKEINTDLLNELVRVFNERKVNDPVIIDWQHATSPFQGKSPAPPESGIALGMIIDLEVKDDGLYAVPAYNEEGLKVVEKSGGILWSSPEYIHGEIFTRDGGDKVGDAQLLAITLTPRPAQSHNKIDRITLSEDLMEEEVKELKAKLAAALELIEELKADAKSKQEEQDAMMNAENDEAEKKTELEDDSEKKAEKEDEKKMMEDDEKDHNKMSENFRQDVALLNEVQALRESVKNLEAENTRIKCDEAVSSLLREGKISVAEKDVASKAWNIRELQPEFWNMFSERPLNSSVPLEEVGHGASGQEISKGTLDQKVRALAEEKKIGYSDALSLFREQQPDFYRQAFGG